MTCKAVQQDSVSIYLMSRLGGDHDNHGHGQVSKESVRSGFRTSRDMDVKVEMAVGQGILPSIRVPGIGDGTWDMSELGF